MRRRIGLRILSELIGLSQGGSTVHNRFTLPQPLKLVDHDAVDLEDIAIGGPFNCGLQIAGLLGRLNGSQRFSVAFLIELHELAVGGDDTETALGAAECAVLGVSSGVLVLTHYVDYCSAERGRESAAGSER